jgi:DNA-binding MarR family transcriptional regulator
VADPVTTGIDDVYAELELVSRRAVARARRQSSPLTFVEHSLLDVIAAEPGRRAIDLAAEFSLNRSTVSRQLAHLVELGAIEVDDGPDSRRGLALSVTAVGRALLARSVDANRAALADRLAGWDDAEVETLATSLARLNSAYRDDPSEVRGGATGGPVGGQNAVPM